MTSAGGSGSGAAPGGGGGVGAGAPGVGATAPHSWQFRFGTGLSGKGMGGKGKTFSIGAAGESSSVEHRVRLSRPADRIVISTTVEIDDTAGIMEAHATVEAEWAAGGARVTASPSSNGASGMPGMPGWLDEIKTDIVTWQN